MIEKSDQVQQYMMCQFSAWDTPEEYISLHLKSRIWDGELPLFCIDKYVNKGTL